MNTSMLFICSIVFLFIPQTRLFALKRLMFRLSGVRIADDVRIVSSCRVFSSGCLTVGAGTWLGHNLIIVGGEANVLIGGSCDFAPNVTLVTGSHQIDKGGERVAGQGYSTPIFIGAGSWIGAGAIILGGAKLGRRNIVAAGSVVKDEFPDNVLLGGTPAKIIRRLDS